MLLELYWELFSYWQGRFAACTFVGCSFGVVTRGTVGALPQTPQGAPPLDPARGNPPLTPPRDSVSLSTMLLPRVYPLLSSYP